MALTAGFATINPESGNGNQVVSVTGQAHTGRAQRSVTVQVQTTGAGTPVTKQVVINQKALAEFVTIDETATVAKEGGTVTINGTSNSSKLTFTLGEEQTLVLTLPGNYMAGGTSTANGVEIADDPGNTAQYSFSITFSDIPANTTVGDLTNILTVTAAGAQSDTCTITQTAGDPTLTVDPETITLEADGTEQQFQITSNTTWNITQVVAAKIRSIFKK